jgi:hypothetical protein
MKVLRVLARRGGGVGDPGLEGEEGERTIPILRWEEKRPRMGRSAGAASFFALGGIGLGSAAARRCAGEESRVFGGKWLLRRA